MTFVVSPVAITQLVNGINLSFTDIDATSSSSSRDTREAPRLWKVGTASQYGR